jgi:putative membrane protein
VAGITDTVNSAEIEQARLAQTKSKDPRVLSFAALMLSHHGKAKREQSALGLDIESSPLLLRLSEQGRQTMATLRDKNGKDFDRAYLQAQIEQHQKVLDTMDRQLLPSAKNAQLRAQLQDMRPTIQQHLEAARDAQQALNTGGQ